MAAMGIAPLLRVYPTSCARRSVNCGKAVLRGLADAVDGDSRAVAVNRIR